MAGRERGGQDHAGWEHYNASLARQGRMGREAGREGRVAVAGMVLDSMGRQRREAGCVRPAAWSRQGTLPRVGGPTALAGRFRPCVPRSESSAGVEWREPTGGSDRRRCHAKAGVKSICLCIEWKGKRPWPRGTTTRPERGRPKMWLSRAAVGRGVCRGAG
jgi:hypothetical protein